jgi:hypothetical protein
MKNEQFGLKVLKVTICLLPNFANMILVLYIKFVGETIVFVMKGGMLV